MGGEVADAEVLVGIDEVEAVVDDALALVDGRLGGSDVHPAVDLPGVGGDHFRGAALGAEREGDPDGDLGLAGRGGAADDEERRAAGAPVGRGRAAVSDAVGSEAVSDAVAHAGASFTVVARYYAAMSACYEGSMLLREHAAEAVRPRRLDPHVDDRPDQRRRPGKMNQLVLTRASPQAHEPVRERRRKGVRPDERRRRRLPTLVLAILVVVGPRPRDGVDQHRRQRAQSLLVPLEPDPSPGRRGAR